MAEGKKSFVLYSDYQELFNHLSDRDAGQLIKHIFKYVNDENPVSENKNVNLGFATIKMQLKRDLKKWEAERSKRSDAGKKGGIKSGESRRNKATRSSASKNEGNEAVNVNVSVNENVNVIEREAHHENAIMIYDVEAEILSNQIQFEKICMTAGAEIPNAKEALRKYHLYLDENEKYPKSRKALFSGFEKWLMNEKTFNNGHSKNNGTAKQNNAHRAVITGDATGAGTL